MMTCRLVDLAPACCTIASVIARTNAFFCVGVRPGHICTVTTGMSWFLLQYLFDPLANTTPLAPSDRHGRPAAQPARPDRRQSKLLRDFEVDASRRRGQIDNER